MYRIKQYDCLTFDNLVKLLAPHMYFPVRESPGLCKHHTHSTLFTLCVEDFVIKVNSLDDAHHLINAIKNISNSQSIGEVKITFVQLWIGTTLKKYVDISMPGYIPTVFQKTQNKSPECAQDAPNTLNKHVYVKHIQLATQ